MRVKNKEIRQRRHRKEQKIKEAMRVIRLAQGDKKPSAPKPKAPTAKKVAPKSASKAPKTEE